MHERSPRGAADIAAVAALMQIGAELGLDQALESATEFSAADLATTTGLPENGVADYLRALLAAGLVVESGTIDRFRTADDYADRRYESGYVAWAMSANSPFLDHAHEFLTSPATAAHSHRRDGRRVAVSSRWIGAGSFHPAVADRVEQAGAKRIVDLGAGSAGLLVDLLRRDPGRVGVALDSSGAACAAAQQASVNAGLEDRLEVVERSIESLVADPSPVEGADVIIACFVMHDALGDPEAGQAVLRACREALTPGGCMLVADAVSYGREPGEREFSALFTYLHAGFMNVVLPTERQWEEVFRGAGFRLETPAPRVVAGGRLFVATK